MTAERSVIGIYCVIFGLYCQIQIKRADRRRNGVLLYALIANFILCTAYFIDSTVQVKFKIVVSHILHVIVLYYCSDIMSESWLLMWTAFSWFLTRNSQEYVLIEDSFVPAVFWMANVVDALYTAIDFISQLILVNVLDIQISSINVFSVSIWSFTDVGFCGANLWSWLSPAFCHLRF